MQESFDRFVLNETDEVVVIDTCEENLQATLFMTQQSRRHIDIISRNLDPQIYNTTEFLESMRTFVLQHRNTRLRVLVYEPKEIVRKGHRFIDMAGTLSSFIQLRTPSEEFHNFNESLFVADGMGYIHKLNSERYEATVNFADKRVSKYLIHQFDEMWEKAMPDSNTRKFHL